MGISRGMQAVTLWAEYFIIMTVTIIFIVGSLSVPISVGTYSLTGLGKTDRSVFIVLLILYATTVLGFSFVISALFNTGEYFQAARKHYVGLLSLYKDYYSRYTVTCRF